MIGIGSEIIHLINNAPELDAWLARAEALHRVLRPHLPPDYPVLMRRILAEGAELALLSVRGEVRALAVFRAFHNTANLYRFYIDDLITAEAGRSQGHGASLLSWCAALAKARGCNDLTLESGTHRERAHRFYFREGMTITAFSFQKRLY